MEWQQQSIQVQSGEMGQSRLPKENEGTGVKLATHSYHAPYALGSLIPWATHMIQ